jgi:hypothetical protein
MTLLDGSLHVFLVWLVRPRKLEANGYSINPRLNIGFSVKGVTARQLVEESN